MFPMEFVSLLCIFLQSTKPRFEVVYIVAHPAVKASEQPSAPPSSKPLSNGL